MSDEVYRIPNLRFQQCFGGVYCDTIFGRVHLGKRAHGWSFFRPGDQLPILERLLEADAVGVAQAWYVERMRDGLEVVSPPQMPFAKDYYILGWLDGNDHMALADDVDRHAVAMMDWEQTETRKKVSGE